LNKYDVGFDTVQAVQHTHGMEEEVKEEREERGARGGEVEAPRAVLLLSPSPAVFHD